jgi:DNA invertase Pin-like site-specific DNA recombinase
LLGGVECAATVQDCQKEADMNRKTTILYERLSREDSRADESLSIENQKMILEKYAVENGFIPFLHISDDGQTGASYSRPGWQELIAMVEADEVDTILLKTLDRMGRDYLRSGLYREMFRERGVRLIAVSDGYDSDNGEDDFTPFREIIAELYARDTSKKIKAVAHAKGSAGKPLSYNAIYGYYKSPDDKNIWLVDEEAAAVVRRIFQMTVDGMGPTQIAHQLSTEHIERPASYLKRFRKNPKAKITEPYVWNSGTVANILTKPEYLGHTVNFRTTKPSFKSKKFKYNPKEDWLVFEDTHPAIIDKPTWDTVQKLRQTPRRSDTIGEPNPLTGLMYCYDCGAKMYNSRQRKEYYEENRNGKVYRHKTADFYTCSANNRGRNYFKTVCSGHFIRTEVVRNLVLDAIRAVSGYVREHEAEFVAKVRETSAIRAEENAKAGKKKLAANQRRIAELDRLFKKTYEDNAAGKLSDKRFEMLTTDYEQEQTELETENAALQAEVDAFAASSERADRFIGIVKRHTEFDELSTAMLNEFVSRILVHEADKSSGERTQEVEIIFNFIGWFKVPAEEKILTAEELAAEEKRRAKLAKQREANHRWYAKKKAEALAAAV